MTRPRMAKIVWLDDGMSKAAKGEILDDTGDFLRFQTDRGSRFTIAKRFIVSVKEEVWNERHDTVPE